MDVKIENKFEKLKGLITSYRGTFIMESEGIKSNLTTEENIKEFFKKHSLKTERPLHEISSDEALKFLALILNKDLAYNAKLVDIEVSDKLAKEFIQLFDKENSKFFTNWDWKNWKPSHHSSNPLTNATFDAGLVVIDKNKIGILCVMDED